MTTQAQVVSKKRWVTPQVTQVRLNGPSVLLACSDAANVAAGTTFSCFGDNSCCVDPLRTEDCNSC